MLVIFEVLLFGVVDLMAESYVLSAVVLYVIMEVCFKKHGVVLILVINENPLYF